MSDGLTSAMCGAIPILGQQGASTTPECKSCVETSCCTEGATCGSNAQCIPYRECVAPCTTTACNDQCGTDFAMGVTDSKAFTTCRNTKCPKECQDVACLGNVLPAMPTSATYAVTLTPLDFQTGKAIPSATIKQCHIADVDCTSPVDMQTTDAMGAATFAAVATSSTGYSDYFEINETAHEPTLFFDVATAGLPDKDGATLGVLVVSKQTFGLLTNVIAVKPDASRGHITYRATTCTSASAVGVSATASSTDAMSTTAYIVGSLPSKTATETDASGIGAFLNLPVGSATLSGTLVSSGAAVGTTSVFVRAGYMTNTNIIPTP